VKTAFGTFAKALSWACIGIVAASVFLSFHFIDRAAQANTRAQQYETELKDLERQAALLTAVATAGETARPLAEVAALAERSLAASAQAHGITLDAVPAFAPQTGHPAAFLPATKAISTSTAKIAGRYATTDGLTAYLGAAQMPSVSLEALRIEGTRFEITVRAWGV
jgi:hypothetical protein